MLPFTVNVVGACRALMALISSVASAMMTVAAVGLPRKDARTLTLAPSGPNVVVVK